MARYVNVTAAIIIPEDATDEHIREWVLFHMGCRGGLSKNNPLSDSVFEAASSFDVDIND